MTAKERLMLYGPDYLSSAELVEIITGRPNGAAVYDELTNYGLMHVRDFEQIDGMTPTAALRMAATMALAKRVSVESMSDRRRIKTVDDVANLIDIEFGHERQEHVVTVLVDSKLKLISRHVVSIGSLDSAPVHPRDVFNPAIKASAAAVIVAHNHPSGDPTPSKDDLTVTKRLIEAGEIIGIKLLDHVVCGGAGYCSIKSNYPELWQK